MAQSIQQRENSPKYSNAYADRRSKASDGKSSWHLTNNFILRPDCGSLVVSTIYPMYVFTLSDQYAEALMLFLSLLVAYLVILRGCFKNGLPFSKAFDILTLVLIPSFFLGHIFAALAYTPEKLKTSPWTVLWVWTGSSSMGVIASSILLALTYLFITKQQSRWLLYGDICAQGAVAGLLVARINCTLIRDHPGALSDFFLAVRYPEGYRHDLGFYEFLFLAVFLLPLQVLIEKSTLKSGYQLGVFATAYAVFRMFSDNLRIMDTTYLGMTPTQYLAVPLMAFGIYVLYKARSL